MQVAIHPRVGNIERGRIDLYESCGFSRCFRIKVNPSGNALGVSAYGFQWSIEMKIYGVNAFRISKIERQCIGGYVNLPGEAQYSCQ